MREYYQELSRHVASEPPGHTVKRDDVREPNSVASGERREEKVTPQSSLGRGNRGGKRSGERGGGTGTRRERRDGEEGGKRFEVRAGSHRVLY